MQSEKYGFIYIWRDRKNNRYYIGSHWGTVDDRYICSSNWMRMSYKRRPEDFRRKIIAKVDTNRADLLEAEQRWLNFIEDEELGKKYYNLRKLALYDVWWMDSERGRTVGERISKSKKGYRHTEEAKIKMSKTRKGKHLSKEHRRKISEYRKGKSSGTIGKHLSEEHRRKISEKLNGHRHSEESKIKMSKASKGIQKSEEHKRKMHDSHMGKHHSVQNKQKISESLKAWYRRKELSKVELYGEAQARSAE